MLLCATSDCFDAGTLDDLERGHRFLNRGHTHLPSATACGSTERMQAYPVLRDCYHMALESQWLHVSKNTWLDQGAELHEEPLTGSSAMDTHTYPVLLPVAALSRCKRLNQGAELHEEPLTLEPMFSS